MRAKPTSKNRLTPPDAAEENGRIAPAPAPVNRADAVRARLAGLGLSGTDVADAVAWARSRGAGA